MFIIITLPALDHFIGQPNVGPLWASYSCPNEIQFLNQEPTYKKVGPDPNKGFNQQKVKTKEARLILQSGIYVLYRDECFTGKYTTRKIHKNYKLMFINDVILVISLYYFIDVILFI